jgi:hypothetical protein
MASFLSFCEKSGTVGRPTVPDFLAFQILDPDFQISFHFILATGGGVRSFIKTNAAGGENDSIMVGMFVSLCLASQKPSEKVSFLFQGSRNGLGRGGRSRALPYSYDI